MVKGASESRGKANSGDGHRDHLNLALFGT